MSLMSLCIKSSTKHEQTESNNVEEELYPMTKCTRDHRLVRLVVIKCLSGIYCRYADLVHHSKFH